MIKTIPLLLVLGITFLGCNDNLDNSIVTIPHNSNLIQQNPSASENPTIVSVSKLIDGKKGGWIEWDTSYVNGKGREIYSSMSLHIPKNAFQGLREIVIQPNPEETIIQLFPEMAFNKPLKLYYEVWGVDLQALGYLTSGKCEFAYFDDYGNIELISTKKSTVDLHNDKIRVLNAKLLHFSRYGWVR